MQATWCSLCSARPVHEVVVRAGGIRHPLPAVEASLPAIRAAFQVLLHIQLCHGIQAQALISVPVPVSSLCRIVALVNRSLHPVQYVRQSPACQAAVAVHDGNARLLHVLAVL